MELPLPVLLQSWLSILTSLLDTGNAALCHPAVTAIQFHGLMAGLLLGNLWLLSGIQRLRELKRQRRRALAKFPHDSTRGSYTTLVEQGATSKPLPGVSVILPVRGCRSHSLTNWRSVLDLHYDGPVEFIFVLEDKMDPAHAAITQLLLRRQGTAAPAAESGAGHQQQPPKQQQQQQHPKQQQQQQQQGTGSGAAVGAATAPSSSCSSPYERTHRIVFSGASTRTSQKIHNLIAGLRAATPSHAYALCLDDDVQLQPQLLASLVADMEADPTLFMATGYPFDVPPEDANLMTYAVMSYHLPLVTMFSIRQRIQFVWGGCQLFRLEAMQADKYGVIKAWSDGGYSDDLTVAAKCTEQGLTIYCPSYAIFPQWVDGDYTPRRWWNYLRRQLYVLDTYSNDHNRRTNYLLALIFVYSWLAFVLPLTTALARLLLWLVAVLLLPTQNVYGGPEESSYLWLRLFGLEGCQQGVWSWLVFVSFTAYMMCTLRWMTGVILALFRQLNPALTRRQLDTFSWFKVWFGMYFSNALTPLCLAYTFLTPHINWAGIRYTRRRGKICSVRHG